MMERLYQLGYSSKKREHKDAQGLFSYGVQVLMFSGAKVQQLYESTKQGGSKVSRFKIV